MKASGAVILTKFLGLGYKELVKHRLPTGGIQGVGTVGLIWATNWYLILDCVIYINGKLKKDN
ncbi:cytochrome b-c1 complex subunit 10-like [Trichosurus vulpecula]|uniref:cytochrome b-c1 complex subunit 10-like n=1 Tax=Trichosurus vulpecula TaxID=9337 RepID=UPI00186AC6E6|nr:cytochrome b-c1 complex subunit 10-like [Trichosurus vulpecula]